MEQWRDDRREAWTSGGSHTYRGNHKKPNAGEIQACRWWLDRELAVIRPRIIVALGSTAAGVLAKRPVAVTRERGPVSFGWLPGYVTIHPSYLLANS